MLEIESMCALSPNEACPENCPWRELTDRDRRKMIYAMVSSAWDLYEISIDETPEEFVRRSLLELNSLVPNGGCAKRLV